MLANGDGPTVLLRCELDALPVREDTGAPLAVPSPSGTGGHEVPVDHACGHDMHMSCMVGMAKLMADHRDRWRGTLIPLFQHAEETGEGAQDMVDDGLFEQDPRPGRRAGPARAAGHRRDGRTRSGPFMSAADSLKITVHGRGGHGAVPQHTVDPVVLAAMIIVRLQTVVSREVAPGDTAVLTVGSCQAGTRSNVIPDHAVLELNIRNYSAVTRRRCRRDPPDRARRVPGQRLAQDPEFETTFSFPVTSNDPATTDRVAKAFGEHFGDHALEIPVQTVSEDFSKIPDAAGVPYTYWGIGFTDRKTYLAAEKEGRLEDLPTNHSPRFLPPLQPTLRTAPRP